VIKFYVTEHFKDFSYAKLPDTESVEGVSFLAYQMPFINISSRHPPFSSIFRKSNSTLTFQLRNSFSNLQSFKFIKLPKHSLDKNEVLQEEADKAGKKARRSSIIFDDSNICPNTLSKNNLEVHSPVNENIFSNIQKPFPTPFSTQGKIYDTTATYDSRSQSPSIRLPSSKFAQNSQKKSQIPISYTSPNQVQIPILNPQENPNSTTPQPNHC